MLDHHHRAIGRVAEHGEVDLAVFGAGRAGQGDDAGIQRDVHLRGLEIAAAQLRTHAKPPLGIELITEDGGHRGAGGGAVDAMFVGHQPVGTDQEARTGAGKAAFDEGQEGHGRAKRAQIRRDCGIVDRCQLVDAMHGIGCDLGALHHQLVDDERALWVDGRGRDQRDAGATEGHQVAPHAIGADLVKRDRHVLIQRAQQAQGSIRREGRAFDAQVQADVVGAGHADLVAPRDGGRAGAFGGADADVSGLDQPVDIGLEHGAGAGCVVLGDGGARKREQEERQPGHWSNRGEV